MKPTPVEKTRPETDALARLKVIDRLEVESAKVEKRRLIARYTVHQAGAADSFELIYRFEEDVFQPGDRTSQNLADLMAAQVALNYGLFCDQIALGVDWYARTAKISPSGVLGDPTAASREKGEQMWRLMVEHLVGLVEHLKRLTLDEIHQRPGQ